MAKPRLDDSLTTEQLCAALDYDPASGIFRWRYRPDCPVQWNGKWAGKQAGSVGGNFITIRINRRHYHAHRLAWRLVYGEFPAASLDHANGDWTDNRIANLRIASRSQNAANSRLSITNTSGFKGVCWDKRAGKWMAQLHHKKTMHFLGYFHTPDEAHAAYCEAASRFFGEFARLK